MLRDAASLLLRNAGAPEGVEKRGLAVVDVPHDGEDGRPRPQQRRGCGRPAITRPSSLLRLIGRFLTGESSSRAKTISFLKKSMYIQYGNRKFETHAQVLSPTFAHGNSKQK